MVVVTTSKRSHLAVWWPVLLGLAVLYISTYYSLVSNSWASSDTTQSPIVLAMILTAGLAMGMKPAIRVADNGPKVDLERMIPKEFGDWKLDPTAIPLLVNPNVEMNLEKFYYQTLSRTYINSRGERVMLSIAMGVTQTCALQVYKPEVCYVAQGFQIGMMTKAKVDTAIGAIPVMRIVATRGSRIEPITYLIKVGDFNTQGWFEQNLARLRYRLSGEVPDGVLVRVSSISASEQAAYRIQKLFLSAMLQALSKEDRNKLVGRLEL